MNAEEALTMAQLNFTVEKVDLQTIDNVKLDRAFATRRTDVSGTDAILGIVGKNYRIIQNHEMLNILDPLVSRKELIYHTAGAIGRGERVWLLAKLPDQIKLNGNDIIDKYLLIFNCHDGSSSLIVKTCFTRVVCNNTLQVALGEKLERVTIRHTTNAEEKLGWATTIMGLANKQFEDTEITMDKMSLKKITDEQLLAYIDNVMKFPSNDLDKTIGQIRKKTELAELYYVGKGCELSKGTVWGALNMVTEYADHRENINEKAFFGSYNALKNRAWYLANLLLN
jgi:phage/plasmid-like protein (TIGR03299 family)